jgi:hypothetical protein
MFRDSIWFIKGTIKRQKSNAFNRHFYCYCGGECYFRTYSFYYLEVIKFLTLFEKDYTSTDRQASLAVKSIVAQMINSILTPVITAYYIKTETGVYRTGGLVDNIFIMAFTISLVPPVLLFFDPYNIFMKIVRIYQSKTSKQRII